MPLPVDSSDIFLAVRTRRSGSIKGECTAAGHVDAIAVRSWRWSAQATSSLGASAATARRSYSGLTIVKGLDTASTALLRVLATNDEVSEAVLTMRKSGDGMLDFFKITLNEARVTQLEHSVTDSGEAIESVSLSFRKVEVSYRRQEGSGGLGAEHCFVDEILPPA